MRVGIATALELVKGWQLDRPPRRSASVWLGRITGPRALTKRELPSFDSIHERVALYHGERDNI